METIVIPEEIRQMSFEKALEELENLVGKMENGGLPLDTLVQSFERGRLLSAHCKDQLDRLERKIALLSRDDGAGGEWREFSEESEASPASPRAAATLGTDEEFIPF